MGFIMNKVTLRDVFLTLLLFSPVSIIPPAPRTELIIGCIADAIHLDLLVAS